MKQSKKNLYVVRKYILANSASDALKREKKIEAHDIWLEETCQKEIIFEMSKNNQLKGFNK